VQTHFAGNLQPIISSLAEVEVLSVFSRLVRTQSLTLDAAKQVADIFTTHLEQGLYGRLNLQMRHYRQARDYIARFDLPLKSPDALHLAAVALEQLPLVTADGQLARNAARLVQLGVDTTAVNQARYSCTSW